MSFPPAEVTDLVGKISKILNARNETISVSESACGGLISSYLVSIPGASSYYHGGTLTYALKSRLKLSGWSESDIKSYTGPSEDVAIRLARNLKYELGSTYSLSETGWAGPTGQDGKTSEGVGQAYFAIVGGGQKSVQLNLKELGLLTEDRAKNMTIFAKLALEFLLEFLEEQEKK